MQRITLRKMIYKKIQYNSMEKEIPFNLNIGNYQKLNYLLFKYKYRYMYMFTINKNLFGGLF
jgi:hypothetical protein